MLVRKFKELLSKEGTAIELTTGISINPLEIREAGFLDDYGYIEVVNSDGQNWYICKSRNGKKFAIFEKQFEKLIIYWDSLIEVRENEANIHGI